jgi:hypothetical protein
MSTKTCAWQVVVIGLALGGIGERAAAEESAFTWSDTSLTNSLPSVHPNPTAARPWNLAEIRRTGTVGTQHPMLILSNANQSTVSLVNPLADLTYTAHVRSVASPAYSMEPPDHFQSRSPAAASFATMGLINRVEAEPHVDVSSLQLFESSGLTTERSPAYSAPKYFFDSGSEMLFQ